MFQISGRQFKALAELAKVTGKSRVDNSAYTLATSPIVSNGHFILTNKFAFVDIQCDGVGSIADTVYGSALVSVKPKVKDTVKFDTGSLVVVDGQTRKSADHSSEMTAPNECAIVSNDSDRLMQLFFETRDLYSEEIAFDPKFMSFISNLFTEFGAPVKMYEYCDRTRHSILVFKSYNEPSQNCGKVWSGFHMRVVLSGIKVC